MEMFDAKILDQSGQPIWPRMIRLAASPRIGEKITIAAPSREEGPDVVKVFMVTEVAHRIIGRAPINDHMLELKVALISEVKQPKEEKRAG